ncbi:MAG: DUF4760 domain-containing protein [Pseudonocardiaceae bacterium]
MNSNLFGAVSLIIALTAVAVAVWQVRAHLVAIEKSNSLPVASAAFNEFRSQKFRNHLFKVWRDAPSDVPEGGFEALAEKWRESAYEVAYFFEHLGILVAYDLVPEELIVGFSSNAVVRSWRTLEPFIQKEREHRKQGAYTGLSPNFVSHFEHLAAIASKIDSRGEHIDDVILRKLKIRKFRP